MVTRPFDFLNHSNTAFPKKHQVLMSEGNHGYGQI